jgi:hypothetical protein
VLLDDLTDSLLVKVLLEVVLDEQLHRGTTAESWALGVLGNGESTTSGRLPDVLLVIIVLGGNLNTLGDEVRRIEPNTELTNHGNIGTGGESLHEGLCTRLGDCSQVVDQIGLGHTNTGITDGEGTLLLVGGDPDVQVLFGVELRVVGKGGISDLVESVRRVGDEFSKEDFLVRVEGVDDEVEKLGNLGLVSSALSVTTSTPSP